LNGSSLAVDDSSALRARAALALRRRQRRPQAEAAGAWRPWLRRHFPRATSAGFAPRHARLWDWFGHLEPGERPPPQVEIWPRGGGKSSTAELGTTFVGTRGSRKFALYVSATQAQANRHVQAIGGHCEAIGLGRATGRYGNTLGWRMDLLRAANGFNVLAFGLDAAGRGAKLDDYRPDLFVLDDIDDRHDSARAIEKKIETLTQSILPMGSPDAAVLVIQNLIHADSIVSQLASDRADFLHGRRVHQEPAIVLEPGRREFWEAELLADGTRRYRVSAGEITWAGQDRATCEHQMNTWGRVAFIREAQHDLTEAEGGLWQRARDIDPFRLARSPALDRIVVAIDPNAGGENIDEAGIIVGGVARVPTGREKPATLRHAYILEDATVPGGPLAWAQAAVDAYQRWGGDRMVAEKNNGGDMVAITIGTVPGAPRVHLVTASRGKRTRAEPVQKLYEDGRVHHIGVFPELERELCTWIPGEQSPNRLDADVWCVTELLLEPAQQMPFTPGPAKA